MMTRKFVKLSTTLGLKFGPVRKGVTPKRILEFTLQDMIRVKDDSVLTNDPEIISWYKGMIDAYRKVAHYIAPLTDIDVKPK